MRKISINPLFVIFCVFIIFLRKYTFLLTSIIALLIHELVHIFFARIKGYRVKKFSLSPFGATLNFDKNLKNNEEPLIALCAPIINIFVSILIVSSWWLFPSTYPYTYNFCLANLFLGIYNLLPFFPFDGGRAILAVTKNKQKTLKIMTIAGLIVGVIFVILGIISIFFEFNIALLFGGITLIYSIILFSKKASKSLIFESIKVLEDFSSPLEKVELCFDEKVKLAAVISHLKPRKYYVLTVLKNGKKFRTIEGAEVNELLLYPRSSRIKDIISI